MFQFRNPHATPGKGNPAKASAPITAESRGAAELRPETSRTNQSAAHPEKGLKPRFMGFNQKKTAQPPAPAEAPLNQPAQPREQSIDIEAGGKQARREEKATVHYKQPLSSTGTTNAPRVGISNEYLEALPQDRIKLGEGFFESHKNKRELLITAAAAKSLTRLFAAMSVEPGSGKEVPASIRAKVLDDLIRSSHSLADDVSRIVVADDEREPPLYLRAKLLQQAAEFLSEQWVEQGRFNADALKALAETAFSGGVDSITQEVVDLFHTAGEYTPATSDEISQCRITEACVRATWGMLKQINDFDINDYDPTPGLDEDKRHFSYGRDPHQVAGDLTRAALTIIKENKLDIDHRDLSTTWTQNSMERAAALVKAEYRLLTDRALRASFKDEMMSEAALNNVCGMYEKILERITERARNSFIQVERHAIDAMSALAYKHYLPRKETPKAEQQSVSKREAEKGADKPLPTPSPLRRDHNNLANQTPAQRVRQALVGEPESTLDVRDDMPDAPRSKTKHAESAQTATSITLDSPEEAEPPKRRRFSFRN